jgi:hypothetical protein
MYRLFQLTSVIINNHTLSRTTSFIGGSDVREKFNNLSQSKTGGYGRVYDIDSMNVWLDSLQGSPLNQKNSPLKKAIGRKGEKKRESYLF